MSTDLIKVKVIPNAVIWVPMLAKGSSTTSQQNTKSNRDHCKSPFWILEGTLCSLTLRNIAIFTARKQSLRRLCFYTCLSVILFMGGSAECILGYPPTRGRHPRTRGRHPPEPEADTPPRIRGRHPLGADTSRAVHAGRYGQKAGSRHPTGMHTC